MAEFIDCITKDYITEVDIIKAIIGKDEKNLAGIRFVIVQGTGEDYVDCTNNQITVSDIFRNLVTLDNCGKPALRFGIETADVSIACCEPLEDCKNPVIPFETIFKRLIGKDADGKPFIRICSGGFEKKS